MKYELVFVFGHAFREDKNEGYFAEFTQMMEKVWKFKEIDHEFNDSQISDIEEEQESEGNDKKHDMMS